MERVLVVEGPCGGLARRFPESLDGSDGLPSIPLTIKGLGALNAEAMSVW